MDLHHQFHNSKSHANAHVEGILTSLVKLTIGEPLYLWSDTLLKPIEKGFFRTTGDDVDQLFDELNMPARVNFWTPLVYKVAAPIYKDIVSESTTAKPHAAQEHIEKLGKERDITLQELHRLTPDDDQPHQDPPTRTSSYFDEVISVSDAQL